MVRLPHCVAGAVTAEPVSRQQQPDSEAAKGNATGESKSRSSGIYTFREGCRDRFATAAARAARYSGSSEMHSEAI